MFDLLRPVTKAAIVAAFIAFAIVANAALLYVTSLCLSSASCIGTGGAAEVTAELRKWSGAFLPGNFYACINFMVLAAVMRRLFDFTMKLMDVTAKAS